MLEPSRPHGDLGDLGRAGGREEATMAAPHPTQAPEESSGASVPPPLQGHVRSTTTSFEQRGSTTPSANTKLAMAPRSRHLISPPMTEEETSVQAKGFCQALHDSRCDRLPNRITGEDARRYVCPPPPRIPRLVLLDPLHLPRRHARSTIVSLGEELATETSRKLEAEC